MEQVISYAFKIILCSGVLYILYVLLFERKVNYAFCRAYLVSTLFLAAAIPVITIPVWPGEVIEIPLSLLTLQQPTEATPVEAMVVIEPQQGPLPYMLLAYAAVSLFFLIAIIQQLLRIRAYRKGSRMVKLGRVALYEDSKIKTPFTFFRNIFIPEGLGEAEKEQIITHELTHARHNHSLELLLMEILKIAFWFNPFMWLLRKALIEVHEYEADNAVIEKGHDPYNYKHLLFRQLFGYSPDISNGLACSRTKKRFTMIDNKKPGRRSLIRAAAAIPVLGTLVMLFSFTNKETRLVYIEDTVTGNLPYFTEPEDNRIVLSTDSESGQVEIIAISDPDSLKQRISVFDGDAVREAIQKSREFMGKADYETLRQQLEEARALMESTDTEEFRQQLEEARALMESNDTEEFRQLMAGVKLSLDPEFAKRMEELQAMRGDFDADFHKQVEDFRQLWEKIDDEDFREQMKNFESIRETFDGDFQNRMEELHSQRESIESGLMSWLENRQNLEKYELHLSGPENVVNMRFSFDGDVSIKSPPLQVIKNLDLSGRQVMNTYTEKGSNYKESILYIDGKVASQKDLDELDIASIHSVTVVAQKARLEKYGIPEGKALILVNTKDFHKTQVWSSDLGITPPHPESGNQPLIIIDGEKVASINFADPDNIENISVLKDKAGIDRYGPEAANGVMIVTTKSGSKPTVQPENDVPFIAVEQMPKFKDGGLKDFSEWVSEQLYEKLKDQKNYGKMFLSFVVERSGKIGNVQILSNTLPKEYEKIIKKVVESSPLWTPGKQRGQEVRVRLQIPIEFAEF